MQYTPKKLHYKPFTLNFIIYLCPQNKISNNPIHVGLYVGFGGINQMHLLIINNLSSKFCQNTYHRMLIVHFCHPILYTFDIPKWFFFNLVEKDMFHHHLNS